MQRPSLKKSIKCKHSLTVQPVFDYGLAERGARPVDFAYTEHYRLIGAGNISLRVWLPRSAYVMGEDIAAHVSVENASNKTISGVSIGLREELVAEGGENEVQSRRATLFHVTHEIGSEAIPDRGNFATFVRLPGDKWYRRPGAVRPSMARSLESSLSRQHSLTVSLRVSRSTCALRTLTLAHAHTYSFVSVHTLSHAPNRQFALLTLYAVMYLFAFRCIFSRLTDSGHRCRCRCRFVTKAEHFTRCHTLVVCVLRSV